MDEFMNASMSMSDIMQEIKKKKYQLRLRYMEICKGKMPLVVTIKRVIFNAPATIVFWIDGSKTVVKAQNGEPFDMEKGLAMAICKKLCANHGAYYNIFREWCHEKEEKKHGQA